MTARNGAHLRAARLILDAPLDKWLSESVAPESTSLPDRAPDTDEALCVVYMFVLEGRVEGIFQDPDTYCLSLTMEVQVCSPSPVLRLARFVGSNDDADAPAWTRLLQPGKLHYFFQPQTFSAEMICGMTGIHVESISSCDISTRMCLWARTVSAGTRVEDDVDAHCRWLNDKDPKAERKPGAPRTRLVRRASPVKPKKLAALSVPPTRSTKLVHRVTCAPIRQPLVFVSSMETRSSTARARTAYGEQGLGKRGPLRRTHLQWEGLQEKSPVFNVIVGCSSFSSLPTLVLFSSLLFLVPPTPLPAPSMSRNLVPCPCPVCEGKSVTPSALASHASRELRQLSTRNVAAPMPFAPFAVPAPTPAAGSAPPDTVDSFIAQHIGPVPIPVMIHLMLPFFPFLLAIHYAVRVITKPRNSSFLGPDSPLRHPGRPGTSGLSRL
ncbi:hypothetical protein C8R47DRAFT_1211286 [Mycena vitilis]|nr:hypothetical protein C8R47DRAFT_1211286 [Mycena vitilis]